MSTPWRDRPLSQTWHVVIPIVVACVAAPALLVSACAAEPPPSGQSTTRVYDPRVHADLIEVDAHLKDGRTIPCLITDSRYGNGLSCDWNAR